MTEQRTHFLGLRSFISITIIIVLALFALTLHWMGRIPWCECGFGLLETSAWSTSTSQHFVDPYTLSHILHGLIFYAVLNLFRKRIPLQYRLLIALGIEVGWEVLENSPIIIERYRAQTASLEYFGDSILNSLGDVLSALVGFWMAHRFSWKWTLGLLIVIEFAMLWAIRDNLTLNIIMLLTPIQAIKEWQLKGVPTQ
ncbi:MAG: DUF2585 family protein [Candidatus Peregrinibacteria bacterium]|nr:DUF2585 family protein [Candidatus Peregrinibacteria bacterium]